MHTERLASETKSARHLVLYLGELRETAGRIAESMAAVDRGYFSATEDDQVQSLLVSYWHSRLAALDLIYELRRDQPAKDPERSVAFLLGFATALALVDAARFLLTATEGRPVVRRKLNQPVPLFSVPGGSFDTIQHSLSSLRHAWHLYHARQYYHEHQVHLEQIANQQDLTDIAESIRILWGRLDVKATDFARYRWRTRGDQVWRKIGRTLFSRSLYGIQKLGSELLADRYVRLGHQPQIPNPIVAELADIIHPGDVFIVRKEFALTNYFLPGYWPHAALYLGTPQQLESMGLGQSPHSQSRWPTILSAAAESGHCVLEAMKDGVNLRCWSSPLSSDSLVLIRPQVERATLTFALSRAISHEGKSYDFDFDFGRADRMVCTEVVYRAYDGVGSMEFPLTHRAGRPTLSGGDLVEMAIQSRHFDAVATYVPAISEQLVTGRRAKEIIEKVVAE